MSSTLVVRIQLQLRKLWSSILTTKKTPANSKQEPLIEKFWNRLQLLHREKINLMSLRQVHFYSRLMKESSVSNLLIKKKEMRIQKIIKLLFSKQNRCRDISSFKLSFKMAIQKRRQLCLKSLIQLQLILRELEVPLKMKRMNNLFFMLSLCQILIFKSQKLAKRKKFL